MQRHKETDTHKKERGTQTYPETQVHAHRLAHKLCLLCLSHARKKKKADLIGVDVERIGALRPQQIGAKYRGQVRRVHLVLLGPRVDLMAM